ncbi:MAG TPA: hypothetical protein VF487_21085 [Chitinophagaceae bacterium]
MFKFNNKYRNKELTLTYRESYLIILTNLVQILSNASLIAQAQVAQTLIGLLEQQKDEQFIKFLNGVDMWGGSGAVWEVNIEEVGKNREFEMEIIKLIDLMKETNILGKGIKPIRKIFEENVKRNKNC